MQRLLENYLTLHLNLKALYKSEGLHAMDIRKAEYDQLQRMLKEWITNPSQELECTFGKLGQVSSTTFAAIGKRLKNRGYTSVTQEDKLNIITPKNVRLSLTGLGIIQRYCRDDRIADKAFIAILKERTAKTSTLDLEEYDVRMKMRNEREVGDSDPEVRSLIDRWAVEQKAFRLLRRWTFRGDGIRFDLSIVKQTYRNSRGEYRWVTKFGQQDISKDLPVYEVEVELEHVEDDTPEKAAQRLIKGVGEVLRGIQKNPILIRNSVSKQVLQGYQTLLKMQRLQFRGASTVTLELRNMKKTAEPDAPNIRTGYNVTDKADGLRTMGYVNEAGHLYLIDQALTVYDTGLQVPACARSLVDGEWITKNRAHEAIHQYFIFDIYIAADGEDIHQLPFFSPDKSVRTRHKEMDKWSTTWNAAPGPVEVAKGLTPKTKLLVNMKEFRFGRPGDDSIFKTCALRVLDTPRVYETDGLIFMSNTAPIPDGAQDGFLEQFKWKPPKDNTIDFMVVTEKVSGSTLDVIHSGFHPTTGKEIRYKVLRLHVGSREDPASSQIKPRDIVLQELPLTPPKGTRGANVYRPVLFYPEEYVDDMANTCYVEVSLDAETGDEYAYCEVSKEPIMDKSIVEISYDPSRPAGWRWVPKLVRNDKTERLMRGELGRTLNANRTAQAIWNSIHEPVTVSMIRTGDEEPTKEETVAISAVEQERAAIGQRYADRTATQADINRVGPLRKFHNEYIKEFLLYNSVMKKPNLLLIDIGMGMAQDIQKWRRVNAGAVLGIDIAGDSINNTKNGAYHRLYSTMLRNGRESVLPMAFVVGDASKNLVMGEAGATLEDKTILESVLGRRTPEGVVPAYIAKKLAGKFKEKADIISCMFATHYFFKSKEYFDGFLRNISENLKIGGYFIGCCFDGEKVFEFLRGREAQIGEEDGSLLWKLTRKYEADEIPSGDEGFGMGIDVEFISIGLPHREYLVPFKLLVDKMRSIGCELCSEADLKEVNLPSCTGTFEESHAVAAKAGRKFQMSAAVQKFSFLNRWFIFRRSADIAPPPPLAMGAPSVGAPSVGEGGSKVPEGPEGVGQQGGAKLDTSKVLKFKQDSAAKDLLKIDDKTALRWLAPGSPFPIKDPKHTSEIYPSIEHFLAGMKYKYATDKICHAQTLFAQSGSIHQKYLKQREVLRGTTASPKVISEKEELELTMQELKDVHTDSCLAGMKRNGAKFNTKRWSELKDDFLKEAVRQRMAKDVRFTKIVKEALKQEKHLLLDTGVASNEYGGKLTKDGVLEGENKYGKEIMKQAKST